LLTNGEEFTEENEGNEDLVAGMSDVARKNLSHASGPNDSDSMNVRVAQVFGN
jgi:hypothetical protein